MAVPDRSDLITRRTRGYLPHWERDGGTYFLTFRLADSLPDKVVARSSDRKQRIEAAAQTRRPLPIESVALAKLSTKRIEELLDAGRGCCALRDPAVAQIVAAALRFWNGGQYDLAAYCIMPNHVHTVARLPSGSSLSELISSWKSYTAKEANRVLHRTGRFWEREYYDHLIRNSDEFDRAVEYVRENPRRAGLQNWSWVYVDSGVCARILAGSRG